MHKAITDLGKTEELDLGRSNTYVFCFSNVPDAKLHWSYSSMLGGRSDKIQLGKTFFLLFIRKAGRFDALYTASQLDLGTFR